MWWETLSHTGNEGSASWVAGCAARAKDPNQTTCCTELTSEEVHVRRQGRDVDMQESLEYRKLYIKRFRVVSLCLGVLRLWVSGLSVSIRLLYKGVKKNERYKQVLCDFAVLYE